MKESYTKKILILTAPAGNGHNTISKAVQARLKELYGAEVETRIYDMFKSADRFRAWMLSKFYFWTAKHFLRTMNRGYERMKRRDVTKIKRTPLHALASSRVRKKAERLLTEFCPDAVVCAHTVAALVMSDLKKAGRLAVPVFNIISDYDIPPFLECCTAVDFFVNPSPDLDGDLLRRGIKQEQILSYGIPVHSKFSEQLGKEEARRALGLREDVFTVLIMNGGVGFGNTKKIIREIFSAVPENCVQIISVCGLNKILKRQIDRVVRRGQKSLFNHGFVENVEVMMSAADLLIGKMGGLTTTEALNKRLCILASTKLPAQEYDNMLFLKQRGACAYIAREREAGRVVAEYIEKPDTLREMRENIDALRRPSATTEIAAALYKAAGGETKRH